jgi:hypothetical protein
VNIERNWERLAGIRGGHGERALRAGIGESQHPRPRPAARSDRGRTRHGPVAAHEALKLGSDPGYWCRRVSLKHDIRCPLRTWGHNRQRQPHDHPFNAESGTDTPRRTATRAKGAKAVRPGDERYFREAASCVSVSWKALAAVSRYWPMPVRPSIIFVAPVLNSA